MTVIGLDDTDSREAGMCTTYVAAELADRLRAAGAAVDRTLLVRLNPAVEHKTRGNAALAVHTDCDPRTAVRHVTAVLDLAATDDPRTNPGAVILPGEPTDVAQPLVDHAARAVRDIVPLADARSLAGAHDGSVLTRGSGRGLIGALAAAGAWRANGEWTAECLAYRERERWGTEREVDRASVFAAAECGGATVWDTVDRPEGTAVCVPRTPCPVLYGIRGEDRVSVERVADAIESEPVARRETFVTNQGTDAHVRPGTIGSLQSDRAYRVTGTVDSAPETRPGGHVFLTLAEAGATLACVAFEPTKRFRDRVRALRPGDRVTACGEVSDGTLKLEKFAVRDLVRRTTTTPTCPGCDRSMSSAGADQGYRCRDCDTTAPGRVETPLDRELSRGWYEVPPVARRHLARPLRRGGFDAPVHPAQ